MELCRTDAQAVAGIRRCRKERIILEEGAHDFPVRSRSLAENSLLRTGVEPARQFLENAVLDQLLKMPIDGRRPARQRSAAGLRGGPKACRIRRDPRLEASCYGGNLESL
jgi:hypothetical protein